MFAIDHSTLQIPNLQELPAVADDKKGYTNCKRLFVLVQARSALEDMTYSEQVYSHAVQPASSNITLNDTPVPQTRLERRAFKGQMS